MLTSAQIAAAADLLEGGKLTEVAQQQLLMLIRSFPRYQQGIGLYPNLESKLSAATGLTAQILQAALTAIERVGAGEESLGSTNSGGVSWSRAANRNEFIEDALNALYPVAAGRPSSAVVQPASNVARVGSGYGCRGDSDLLPLLD